MDTLSETDIINSQQSHIYTQSYQKPAAIDGVRLIELNNHVGEDGDFSEILRLAPDGTVSGTDGFRIAQINRSKIQPSCIKAWHLHYKQDEIWYVPPHHQLFVGLWDVRKNAASADKAMRLVLGGGNSKLLYIPRGVAHGYANLLSIPADLYYFVSNQFDTDQPDEQRLPWDSRGADFWQPERD